MKYLPSGREGVLAEIDGVVEDISRLLGHSLLNMIVSFHLRAVSCVSRNRVRLARRRCLCTHISSASSVEVSLRPSKELS